MYNILYKSGVITVDARCFVCLFVVLIFGVFFVCCLTEFTFYFQHFIIGAPIVYLVLLWDLEVRVLNCLPVLYIYLYYIFSNI